VGNRSENGNKLRRLKLNNWMMVENPPQAEKYFTECCACMAYNNHWIVLLGVQPSLAFADLLS